MALLKYTLLLLFALFVFNYFIIPTMIPSKDEEAKLYAKLHGGYANILAQNERVKTKTPPRNIAVIGGGIAGTSLVHFLNHLFGTTSEIDLHESSHRLCGRVSTTKFNGREFEIGASIIHPKNYYLVNFREELGLNKSQHHQFGHFGVFDGEKYLFQSSSNPLVTYVKMLLAFGRDILKLNSMENQFMDDFIDVYKMLARGHSFTSVEKFLEAFGHHFTDATKTDADWTFHHYNMTDRLINSLVKGALLNNFGQTTSVNGFVGLVSMAGVQPGLWSIEGGNHLLCNKLINGSNVKVLQEKVTEIASQTANNLQGPFAVFTESGKSKSYDLVFMAAPFGLVEMGELCQDECEEMKLRLSGRTFRQTVATLVKGRLRSSIFKCKSTADCPTAIFIGNDQLFYRSVGFHMPVDFNPQLDNPYEVGVYKIFSSDPLTKEQMKYLFDEYSDSKTITWKRAYPQYKPPDPMLSFVLNKEGIYYSSAIEWAASTMETSVLASKNVANLAYNRWFGIDENVDNEKPLEGNLYKYKEDL